MAQSQVLDPICSETEPQHRHIAYGEEQGQPLVSVVIPTKNRPRELARALHSVFRQTMTDFEVIVVDDGSDKPPTLSPSFLTTAHVVKAIFGVRDDWPHTLNLISLPESVGAVAARAIGIKASQGKYLAFLDDDDEWTPDKLARQTSAAAATHAAFCTCNAVRTDGRYSTLWDVSAGRPFPDCITSTILCDRVLYLEVGGFDPRFRLMHGEADLYYSMLPFGYHCDATPLVILHDSLSSMSHGGEIRLASALALERLLCKHHSHIFAGPRSVVTDYYARIGLDLVRARAGGAFYRRGLSYLRLAVRRDPSNLSFLVATIASHIHPALLESVYRVWSGKKRREAAL